MQKLGRFKFVEYLTFFIRTPVVPKSDKIVEQNN